MRLFPRLAAVGRGSGGGRIAWMAGSGKARCQPPARRSGFGYTGKADRNLETLRCSADGRNAARRRTCAWRPVPCEVRKLHVRLNAAAGF
jgi:hypothetical protein